MLHVNSMSMIQIRNVPPGLHRKLKAKAKATGKTLSDYLLAECERMARQPTIAELTERLSKRKPIHISRKALVESIRQDRDSH